MRVDRVDGIRELALDRSLEPAAQETVDEQFGIGVELTLPRPYRASIRDVVGVRLSCVPPKLPGLDDRDDRHVDAVGGIVAGAANHLPAARRRVSIAGRVDRRPTRAGHQRVPCDSFVFDCAPVDLADGSNRVHFNGHRHADDYTGNVEALENAR